MPGEVERWSGWEWELHGGEHDGLRLPYDGGRSVVRYTGVRAHRVQSAASFFGTDPMLPPVERLEAYQAYRMDRCQCVVHAAAVGFRESGAS